ncbi:MAG: tetratricopeptide repeat protein, partial [Myxococcota bacterium]
GAPAAPANPFGAPASNPFGAAPAANPFGPPPGGAAAPNPFGAPPAGAKPANPFGAPASDPFGGGGPKPGGDAFNAPPPAGSGKNLPAGSPFSFTPAGAPPAAPGGAPDGGGGGGDPFSPAPAAGGGGSDPFDSALDTVDSAAPGSKEAREWRIKLPDGTMLGPLTQDEVRNKIKAGEITKDAQAAQGNTNFRPITGYGSLAVVFRGPDSKAQKVVYRKQDSGAGKWIALGALLLVGAGGATGWMYKDKFLKPAAVEADNIFVRRAQMWRLQFPDVEGTSEEHVIKGIKYFRDDTTLGYRLADEEFHKALVLDPDNIEAIGAYVENFALLPSRRTDAEAIKDAMDGIDYAIKKAPRRARLHRANGALLLKIGNIDAAQAALAQALRLEPQDAESKLLMAQTNLDRNVGESVKLTEEAIRIDPELKRASYILGQAYQKQGRFKTALNQFRSRLAKDKDHKETLLAIARLFVEVGDFPQAVQNLEKVLEIDPKNVAARLQLAKVLYQGLGDLKKAEQQLNELVNTMGTEAGELARDVYTHQAFVLGERGKWKEAEEAVNLALKDDPSHGPALYVAGRVFKRRGAAAEAREKLEKAVTQVSGSYLEAPVRTMLADVLREQNQHQEAIRNYNHVMKNDARYVRAYLGAASLHAETGNMQQAAAVMREVLDIDPFHRTDHFYFTDYPETPSDTQAYRSAWTKSKPDDNDRSLVFSSEGITAFHADQLDDAFSLLKKALADDQNNLGASMYLGAAMLAKKNAKEAQSYLEKATTTNKLHVRTMYLQARAFQLAGAFDKAEQKFQEVRDADGNFVAAMNAGGEMALRKGEDERARDLFLDAFRADQDFTPAKANLLKCNY